MNLMGTPPQGGGIPPLETAEQLTTKAAVAGRYGGVKQRAAIAARFEMSSSEMQAGFTPLVPFSGVPSAVKQAAATKRDVWLDPVLAPSLALAPRWARGERREARG